MPPNTILVIEQDKDQNYRLTNKILIKEVNQYTQFKLYKFNNEAMMLLEIAPTSGQDQAENKITTKAFVISPKGYKEVAIDIKGAVSYFQAEGKEFFTAEYGEGVKGYSYD